MTGQTGVADPNTGNLPGIGSVSDQTTSEKDIIEYIKRRVTEVRQNGSRVAQESIWMTNYAYLMGFDSIYYDTTTRQYRNVGRATSAGKRGGLSINKILPIS